MVALRWFRWLSAGPVPDRHDLRRLGWRYRQPDSAEQSGEFCLLLACPARLSTADWFALVGSPPDKRRVTLLTGVDDSADRERLLRLGFGDTIGSETALGELEARALKLAEQAGALPRQRRIGTLELDLLARDARVAGRRIGLHPREFALLWRLADRTGETVSPAVLLGDVWQMAFRPETNSLAVHVSRLRAKLRIAGVDGLIETTPDGGYRLAIPAPAPTTAHRAADLALDAHARLREESRTTEQEARHEA